MDEICKALNRLIKIYQIPNIDQEAVMFLAEWIMDEYQHNDFELIQEALKYPPRNLDNTWRMTPDTIRFWIDKTREKLFDKKAKEESEARQKFEDKPKEFSPETEKLIQDFKNKLLDGIRTVPEMDDKDIKANGQVRPKAIVRASTDENYVSEWVGRIRNHQEYTYRERHPNCTDQEVQQFLDNL